MARVQDLGPRQLGPGLEARLGVMHDESRALLEVILLVEDGVGADEVDGFRGVDLEADEAGAMARQGHRGAMGREALAAPDHLDAAVQGPIEFEAGIGGVTEQGHLLAFNVDGVMVIAQANAVPSMLPMARPQPRLFLTTIDGFKLPASDEVMFPR